MIIVTGTPFSGKSTLCQSIPAIELPLLDAIKQASALKSQNIQFKVIYLKCASDIAVNRALAAFGQSVFQHISKIMDYREPHTAQLKLWFDDVTVVNTDAGINLNMFEGNHASN